MTTKYIKSIRTYEVEVPENATDEEVIEGYNLGDLPAIEVDGHIELEDS